MTLRWTTVLSRVGGGGEAGREIAVLLAATCNPADSASVFLMPDLIKCNGYFNRLVFIGGTRQSCREANWIGYMTVLCSSLI